MYTEMLQESSCRLHLSFVTAWAYKNGYLQLSGWATYVMRNLGESIPNSKTGMSLTISRLAHLRDLPSLHSLPHFRFPCCTYNLRPPRPTAFRPHHHCSQSTCLVPFNLAHHTAASSFLSACLQTCGCPLSLCWR